MKTPEPVHVCHMYVRTAALTARLAEDVVVNSEGCHIVQQLTYHGLVRGFPDTKGVSIPRLVYAMCHPGDDVKKTDLVIHTCPHGTSGTTCCVNPDHLVKTAKTADKTTFQRARRVLKRRPAA